MISLGVDLWDEIIQEQRDFLGNRYYDTLLTTHDNFRYGDGLKGLITDIEGEAAFIIVIVHDIVAYVELLGELRRL